jgi:hypothetical protein
MNSFFDRLNMRPQERRLVVIVGAIVFVVLNLWFVWPFFGQLKPAESGLDKARQQLAVYQAEVGVIPEYQAKLEKLSGAGSKVMVSDQLVQFQNLAREQAQRSSLPVSKYEPVPRTAQSNTNIFFEEQSLKISVQQTGDKELVDFLYNLGAGNSMIRVRDLVLNAIQEPNQTQLRCSATLVASYQRAKPIEPRLALPATNRPVAIRKP